LIKPCLNAALAARERIKQAILEAIPNAVSMPLSQQGKESR